MRVTRPTDACKETCECMQRCLLIERCKEKYSYYNAPIFIFGPFRGRGIGNSGTELLMRPSNSVQRELLMLVKRPSNACSKESS